MAYKWKDPIEWKDGSDSKALDSVITIFMTALLVFIYLQLANEYTQGGGRIPLDNIFVAIIFLFLLFWGLLSHFADEIVDFLGIKKEVYLARYVSFGENLRSAFIGLFLGLFFGYIMNSTNLFTLALPTFAAGTVIAAVETRVWVGIWTVVVAPFVEEKVFAGSLPFQLHSVFLKMMPSLAAQGLAFLVAALFFAGMHFVIFQFQAADLAAKHLSNPELYPMITAEQLLWSAFIFRLVVLAVNSQFKSWLPSYGMHFMGNLLQYLKYLKTVGG